MDDGALFALDGVTVRHGAATILDRVTASIPAGRCTGLVGRSGAGKSSLLRLLTRLDIPDEGTISYRAAPLATYDVLALRREVQLVPQRPVLVTDQIAAEVRLGRPTLPDDEIGELLARVDLPESYADRPTEGLSGGEVQRVALARALAMGPTAILLDEPTSALDAASAAAIEATVQDFLGRGGTVVLVSHDPAQVERITDHLLSMVEGRVVT